MRRGNVAGFVFDWLTEEWTVGERRNSGQPELQPSGESGPDFSPDFMARSRERSSGKKYGALWHYRVGRAVPAVILTADSFKFF